jgi:hypothetical protein
MIGGCAINGMLAKLMFWRLQRDSSCDVEFDVNVGFIFNVYIAM